METMADVWRNVWGGLWNWLTIDFPDELLVPSIGLVAAVVAFGAMRQKRNADRKAEWWKRTQYGLDLLVSGEKPKVLLGASLIGHLRRENERQILWLGQKRLADKDDIGLFKAVTGQLLRVPSKPAIVELRSDRREELQPSRVRRSRSTSGIGGTLRRTERAAAEGRTAGDSGRNPGPVGQEKAGPVDEVRPTASSRLISAVACLGIGVVIGARAGQKWHQNRHSRRID